MTPNTQKRGNVTPDATLVLREALVETHACGEIHSAVVTAPNVPWIRTSANTRLSSALAARKECGSGALGQRLRDILLLGDKGWGCGHRSLEMLLCVLETRFQRDPALSFSISSPGSSRSILDLQHLIEEAWKEGFDPAGAVELDGKVVGTRKWIGTSELYCALTHLGVPVRVYDFGAASKNDANAKSDADTNVVHDRLLSFIRHYFDSSLPPTSTSPFTSTSPSTGPAAPSSQPKPATSIRTAPPDLAPLFLQHRGHSRLIVGYEIRAKDGAKDGGVTLLVLDPGRLPPKTSSLSLSLIRTRGAHSSHSRIESSSPSSSSSRRALLRELRPFRLSLKELRKYTHYQLLRIESERESLLSAEERAMRRLLRLTLL